MQAKELIDHIRQALKAVDDEIRSHEFLDRVEKGEVSEQALRVFAGNQYHMMVSIVRADGHLLQRFAGTSLHEFFFELLGAKVDGYSSLKLLAARLGMDHDGLERFDIDPDAFAYAAYVTWLAVNGSLGEIVCGLSVNLPAWAHNCRRLGAALRSRYGISAEETAYLDGHTQARVNDEVSIEAANHDLACQVPPERILRAARMIQAYELRFWDAMASAARSD